MVEQENTGVRLEELQAGSWRFAVPEMVIRLDQLAQKITGLPAEVPWLEFLCNVDPGDRDSLNGAYQRGGKRPGAVTLRFTTPDGTKKVLQSLGALTPTGPVGVLVEVEVPEEDDLSRWGADFAAALSKTLTTLDVAAVAQEVGAEILGAGWIGVADTRNGTLTHLVVDRLPTLLQRRWKRPDRNHLATRVLEDQVAQFYPGRTELLQVHPDLRNDLEESNIRAWAAFPLNAGHQRLGVLSITWDEDHTYTPEQIRTLTAIAGQVAQSLQRSHLYERQRDMAGTLQKTFLPTHLPRLPGVELAGRHLAAEVGTEVGGDWYDAFPVDGERLAVVVGDVEGHGLRAASTMGQLRSTLRALLHQGRSPREALEETEAVLSHFEDGARASIHCGVYHQSGEYTWSAADHPGLLLPARKERPAADGRPLGAGGERREQKIQLEAGETILVYTDGLLPGDRSIERLERATREPLHATLEVRCTRMLEAALGELPRPDDVAVLVLHRLREDERSWEEKLPASLESPARARALVEAQLKEWKVGHLSDTTLLLLSEVVTNAVIHANSTPRVELSLDRDSLVVSVHDTSELPPIRRRSSLTATSGRGMALVDTMADRWGVDTTSGGKDVWFELYTTRPPETEPAMYIDESLRRELAELGL